MNLMKADSEETYGDWKCSSMHFWCHNQSH